MPVVPLDIYTEKGKGEYILPGRLLVVRIPALIKVASSWQTRL
jgi:hypothetical protein